MARPLLGEIDNEDTWRERFAESGFLLLPNLLPDHLLSRLIPEVDHWVDGGLRDLSIAACVGHDASGPPPTLELELPAHGELLTYEPLMHVLTNLIGPSFVFHHLHSARHGPDVGGKPWHHDHEPNDSEDHGLVMVHALHYPGGLSPTVGGLALLPGSHRERADRTARSHLGVASLPGEVVVDSLPPGSTVLLNSALFHARRPAAGATGQPRYFIDASYCQTGARWRPVKPYWRYMLARARELNLDGGRRPELFSARHFSEYGTV